LNQQSTTIYWSPKCQKVPSASLVVFLRDLINCHLAKKKKKITAEDKHLSASGHRLQMPVLQNGSLMCFISWYIIPAKKYSPGCTTFSFFLFFEACQMRTDDSEFLRLCCLNTYFESSTPVLSWKLTFQLKPTINSAENPSLPLKIVIFLLDRLFVKFSSLPLASQHCE